MESAEREYSSERAPAEELPKLIKMTESQFQTAVYGASNRVLQASDPLASRLVEFAAWAQSETDARTLGEAIAVSASRRVPSESWQEISNLELGEIARAPSHPYDIIESWAADLPARDRFIFQHRVASPARSHTLQEIADSLSLSRERVRQVEKRVLSKFVGFSRKKAAAQVKWRLETLRQLVGVAAPVSQVETLLRPNDIRMDYSQLLLKMAGPYEIVGDWIVSRAAMTKDPTQSVIDMADEFGFIDLEDAHERLLSWGMDPSFHISWLTRNGTIRTFDGRLARWVGSIADKLVLALAIIGHPTTLDTLLEWVQEDRSRATATNALSGDSRVVRASSTEWTLVSWGFPEYHSIAMSIRDLLSDSRGPVQIDEIISRIARDFGSAEASIRAYCYAPMFVVQNGWVRLRDDNDEFTYSEDSPRTARGVFRLGQNRVSLLIE